MTTEQKYQEQGQPPQGEFQDPRRKKRLYRSRRHRMIGGVCGGTAEYFGVDPVLLRIACIIFALAGGWGIVAYIIGLIVIPESTEEASPTTDEATDSKTGKNGMIWGTLFIIVGLILLLNNYGWFPWSMWNIWHVSWRFFWPFVLIFIGMILLMTRSARTGNGEANGTSTGDGRARKLHRSRTERMVGGVCGGIAAYFRLDPTLVRLLWAFGTILSRGLGVIVYVILLIVLQDDEVHNNSIEPNREVER